MADIYRLALVAFVSADSAEHAEIVFQRQIVEPLAGAPDLIAFAMETKAKPIRPASEEERRELRAAQEFIDAEEKSGGKPH